MREDGSKRKECVHVKYRTIAFKDGSAGNQNEAVILRCIFVYECIWKYVFLHKCVTKGSLHKWVRMAGSEDIIRTNKGSPAKETKTARMILCYTLVPWTLKRDCSVHGGSVARETL